MEKKIEMVILVSGGCVQEVRCTDKNIKVLIRDLDIEGDGPTHVVKQNEEDGNPLEYQCIESEVNVIYYKEIDKAIPIEYNEETDQYEETS